MALTPEQIDAIDVRTLGHQHFARAIEAEVRKGDEALIRQCMEALECAEAYTALIDDISLSAIQEARKAARVRLESKL